MAAIVLSKDRPDLFARCAASVPAQYPVIDRIVVQNGTDAETPAIARAAGWKVLEPGFNTSFSVGNAYATHSADRSATHLLLLNNDAVLHPGAVEALWAARDKADIVGSFILRSDGLVDHAGIFFDRNLNADHLGHGLPPDPYFPRGQDIANLAGVTFACALVSRRAWSAMRGLDSAYWYCCEDTDFCLRVREAGGSIMVARDAVVTHQASSTRDPQATAAVAEQVFWERWRGARLLRAIGAPQTNPWGRP